MTLKILLRAALCLFFVVPMRAEATIDSVIVNTTSNDENAVGYTCAGITLHRSVARADGSVGRYSVPAVIIHPKCGRGNRIGVVDWLNPALYHFFPSRCSAATRRAGST